MPATNEYIEQIKNTLKDKKNADVYILNDKLTLSVFFGFGAELEKCAPNLLDNSW